MIETCKDCRHCDKRTYFIREWDKEGLHRKNIIEHWCKKFNMEVPPINRCKYINEPIKIITKPEIMEIE